MFARSAASGRSCCALARWPSLILIVLATACTNAERPTVLETSCEDPRPQICTREYRPVCATRDNGVRCVKAPCPSTEVATYGNACTACADPAVIHHHAGECGLDD
jgi:hypothetical protein